MPCVDFIVMGEAEVVEDGCIDARFALLPNNPRRVLRRPIVLTSSGTSSDFTLPFSGLTSANAKGDATAPTDALPDTEPSPASSTDFVLQFDDVTLYSDNARCTHFVTDGLCSTKITNKDVLWMEKVADLSPGT